MSIEALMGDLTAALNKNSTLLERVIAGQEAAMAKLEGSTAAPAARRTRKAADAPATDAPAEGNESAPAATEQPVADAAAASEPAAAATFTQDDLKAAAMGWRKAATEAKDEAALKKQGELFLGIAAHFGSPKLTGPESTLTSEQIKQAVFFTKRAQAGLSVDFSADYDFDGAVDQGAAASADEDPFG